MNSQQAKETLLLYRPGVADPDDSDFSEALELVRQDAELGRWFEDHCRLQELLHARFSQLPVPEALKEQILAERKIVTHPAFSRKTLQLCAAAAVLMLLTAAVVFFRQGPREDNTFANFRNRMAGTVLRQYPKMDLETHDLDRIHQYLAQHGQGDYVLPAALAKATPTGCATLSWHERDLSMLCFNSGQNGKPNEPDLFLFVINRSAVHQSPPPMPELVQLTRHFATASWTSGDKTYFLGVRGDEKMLRSYL